MKITPAERARLQSQNQKAMATFKLLIEKIKDKPGVTDEEKIDQLETIKDDLVLQREIYVRAIETCISETQIEKNPTIVDGKPCPEVIAKKNLFSEKIQEVAKLVIELRKRTKRRAE